MTKIYYADRKFELKKTQTDQTREKTPPIHAGTSWVDTWGYVFWFLERWIRYRLYVLYNLLPVYIQEGIAGALGQLFLGFSKPNRHKVEKSFQAIYLDSLGPSQLKRLYWAHCAYMGKLVFDFMNGLPKNVDRPVTDFIEYENFHLLDRELNKGKGVIIPLLHLGQLVHGIYAIGKHPNKYNLATVVYTPHLVTYKFTNREGFDNVFLYSSTSYKRISQYLEHHLKQNHIVLLYYDFGTKKQLRVPFWVGKYPYLLHTPQSIASLFLKTGASILPCISAPNQVINHSRVKFLDNSNLMAKAENHHLFTKKENHGRISTELNKLMYPYVCKYARVWEEIPDFATSRAADSLKIIHNYNIQDFTDIIFWKIQEIIEKSYEPSRDDNRILKIVEEFKVQIKDVLISDDQTLALPGRIDLSLKNSFQEIIYLLDQYTKNIPQVNRVRVDVIITDLKNNLSHVFYSKSDSPSII